jgi:ribose transport system substrate-binding protein
MFITPRAVRCAAVALTGLLIAACGTTSPTPGGSAPPSPDGFARGPAGENPYFDQADYERQLNQRGQTPQGDPATPWRQAISPSYVDTTKYAKPGDWHVCFSNAGVGTPWRVTGMTTMRAEKKLHPRLAKFTVVDAESKDDKQIADITALLARKCDALIVSPNTTATLTPAVEKACESGVPVVVFDRGVETECPVTFVHSIGGYAFGATAAEFVKAHVGADGRVLALRIRPGVEVLENRWAAAKTIFDQAGIHVVGVDFTDGDPARTKGIVTDYLQRFGKLDGIWMDAGTTTAAAAEAFEDVDLPVPPITGEDRQDFLELWQKKKLTAIAPTDPVYMWRTALIAATEILAGHKVPKDWVLPQPTVTDENLAEYLRPGMPPLFHPTCGCQEMPGFPQAWGGR